MANTPVPQFVPGQRTPLCGNAGIYVCRETRVVIFSEALMYVVCQSELENRISCFTRAMQDTCRAPDVNVLIAIIYYSKFFNDGDTCALGESCLVCEVLDWGSDLMPP